MADTFFTSWELWQEMTFVLAMGIAGVFCAGLCKLWWNNRLLRKQELLDVEKRARIEELRKTGLSMKRANTVPFGVRAIQSGVEVDGIWISRPASLHEPSEKHASSTTIAGRDMDSQKKSEGSSTDERSSAARTAYAERKASKQSPFAVSAPKQHTDTESTDNSHFDEQPVSQSAHRAPRPSSRPPGALNEDTLRRLEGRSPTKPHFETYVPTSSSRPIPCRPGHQSSASSSADSAESQMYSARSTSGMSNTSSQSSKLYMATRKGAVALHRSSTPGGRTGRDSSALRRWSEKEEQSRDPFATPARTPSGFSVLSTSETGASSGLQQQQQQQQHGVRPDLAAPEPTFGPGDLYFNRASRRVNEGFQVLPAGTFGGISQATGGEKEAGLGGRASKSTTKLRKSGAH